MNLDTRSRVRSYLAWLTGNCFPAAALTYGYTLPCVRLRVHGVAVHSKLNKAYADRCDRKLTKVVWSSPRPISTAKLNILLCLHTQPINLVVYKGSYWLSAMGYLILEAASRLDAFSVYPFRT